VGATLKYLELIVGRWKERRIMKRRVCSYDMLAVPDPSFVLKDTVGEMYFCNLRRLCVWSVLLATRPNLSIEDKTGAYWLTTPSGEEHQFAGIVDVVGYGHCSRIKRFRSWSLLD
jgi:hypothetical protein